MNSRELLSAVSLLLAAAPLAAEELLRTIEWSEATAAAGVVLPANAEEPWRRLEIRHQEAAPETVALLAIDSPAITRSKYALRGEIRYEGVEGDAYLEMWSLFAGEERYFSRTLGDRGPMGKLQGSSGWRPVLLPFFNQEGGPSPRRLEVNLVLPSRGTVWIGPLRLVQYEPNEDPFAAASGAWWSDSQAGLVGGLLGALLGIGGALAGVAAARGRARRFAIGFLAAALGMGGLALGAGVFALALDQPRGVTFTLLLLGGLCVLIAGPQLPKLRRLYEQAELRRMQAHDVR